MSKRFPHFVFKFYSALNRIKSFHLETLNDNNPLGLNYIKKVSGLTYAYPVKSEKQIIRIVF